MANWEFEEVPARFVQQNPTQRDQFNNDEVGLAEALVREVIQNSTDARAGPDPVKVCFTVHTVPPQDVKRLSALFSALRPHLNECGVSDTALDASTARLLVVEDFGTKGLTGNPGQTDGQNFTASGVSTEAPTRAELRVVAGALANLSIHLHLKSVRSSDLQSASGRASLC